MKTLMALFLMFLFGFPGISFASEEAWKNLKEGDSQKGAIENLKEGGSSKGALENLKRGPTKDKSIKKGPIRQKQRAKVLFV